MKRIISSALVLGLLSLPAVGLVGCGEESKVETKETIKTPEGTKTTTSTDKVETSGKNPPSSPADAGTPPK